MTDSGVSQVRTRTTLLRGSDHCGDDGVDDASREDRYAASWGSVLFRSHGRPNHRRFLRWCAYGFWCAYGLAGAALEYVCMPRGRASTIAFVPRRIVVATRSGV
jgi:hypothetical protein